MTYKNAITRQIFFVVIAVILFFTLGVIVGKNFSNPDKHLNSKFATLVNSSNSATEAAYIESDSPLDNRTNDGKVIFHGPRNTPKIASLLMQK